MPDRYCLESDSIASRDGSSTGYASGRVAPTVANEGWREPLAAVRSGVRLRRQADKTWKVHPTQPLERHLLVVEGVDMRNDQHAHHPPHGKRQALTPLPPLTAALPGRSRQPRSRKRSALSNHILVAGNGKEQSFLTSWWVSTEKGQHQHRRETPLTPCSSILPRRPPRLTQTCSRAPFSFLMAEPIIGKTGVPVSVAVRLRQHAKAPRDPIVGLDGEIGAGASSGQTPPDQDGAAGLPGGEVCAAHCTLASWT